MSTRPTPRLPDDLRAQQLIEASGGVVNHAAGKVTILTDRMLSPEASHAVMFYLRSNYQVESVPYHHLHQLP